MEEWPIHTLVDVTDLITCGVAKRPNYVDSGVPFLSAKNVKNGKVVWSDHRFITQEDHNELTKNNKPLRGDVLYTRVGSFGEAAIVDSDNEFSVFVSLTLIKPKHDILINQYLKYYLNSSAVKELAKSSISGSGVGNLNVGTVRKFPIPLPPIPEQKRIVALLDTVFADLEQTRAKTEQNLKNSRELFDSYLQQIFSQKGEGWVETTLGSEINLLTGFAFKSKEYVTHSNSTPLIRGDNVVQGKLRWDGVKLWSNDTISDYQKYQLEVDDIVIAMDRTWVKAGMKFSKITSEDLPALLVQRVARLRALDSINSYYLYHLVGSKLFESYVLSIQTGLGVPHISGKQIQAFSFNKPDIEQQRILVSTMNDLKSEVSKLDIIYQKKLAAIDELKKSILQKAFSGELTTMAK
jgi:type I restriction enzyme S subunit